MDLHEEDGIDREMAKKKITFLMICFIIIKHISMHVSIHKRISTYGSSDRAKYLKRIYQSDDSCITIVRMNRSTFAHLVGVIRERQLLHETIHVSIEEQLMMFLHVVGHNQRNRVIGFNFVRSGATVSKYFGKVLRAIVALKDAYMPPPDGAVPDKVKNDTRFWPFFKDCIGAIDGTHILAKLPSDIVARFRGRYKQPTQNVMAVVRFDLRFSYVLACWEGSANDCTVLRNALERPNGLRVPAGKYFLGDAGFFMRPGFLLPYRGMRYHRTEFSQSNPPANAKELFNLRHSSLRTTIECTFGILKQRFRVIDGYNHFPYRTQVVLVLVCCILHNFIMDFSPNNSITRDATRRHHQNSTRRRRNQNTSTALFRTAREMREDNSDWRDFRDRIANEMWQRDYDVLMDED